MNIVFKLTALNRAFILLTLVSVFALSLSLPAFAENLDDGYPQGQPAPGRSCPNTEVGFTTVSEITAKSLVCTLIIGEKKWWIVGEALPTVDNVAVQKGVVGDSNPTFT